MAVITEESDAEPNPKHQGNHHKPPNPSCSSSTNKTASKNQTQTQNQNPFAFWFYFTLFVSLLTLLVTTFSSFNSTRDPKSHFLSLPTSLRRHYSSGRILKVQPTSNHSPIELFTLQSNPNHSNSQSETVIILPGLCLSSYAFREVVAHLGSKGIRALAIDLPGHGFSDKVGIEKGGLWSLWEVYELIKEKGLFWAFDQMVETGEIPYQEIEEQVSKRKRAGVLELGPEEIGRVLGQVIDLMNLAPAHLVLHDSALGFSANWIAENLGLVRSVTLVDTDPNLKPAFPVWVLKIPVVGGFVMGFSGVYRRLLSLCCSKGLDISEADAHRLLLKREDGRRAVLGSAKKLNYSFELEEWRNSEGMNEIPAQVIWSGSWSEEWNERGKLLAHAIPGGRFMTHSGGRWPEEGDAANELAKHIVQFVFSLPKSVRKTEEEDAPQHIPKAKIFDHAQDYMDRAGFGHGWET